MQNQKNDFQSIVAVILMLAVIVGLSALALGNDVVAADIALIGFIAIATILVAFATVVLWQVITGELSLNSLIAEPEDVAKSGDAGKASLSRFQLLIFTFVIAGLFLMLSIENGGFVDIPTNVLGLLGISGGSFVVSKAVGMQNKNKPAPSTQQMDRQNNNS